MDEHKPLSGSKLQSILRGDPDAVTWLYDSFAPYVFLSLQEFFDPRPRYNFNVDVALRDFFSFLLQDKGLEFRELSSYKLFAKRSYKLFAKRTEAYLAVELRNLAIAYVARRSRSGTWRGRRLPPLLDGTSELPSLDQKGRLLHPFAPSTEAVTIAAAVSAALLERIRSNPGLLQKLRPRQFEELLAELLASHGWSVSLTPKSKDGGYDIFGICKNVSGVENAWLIECKRYRRDRKVGVDIVRSLWGVANQKSNIGAMVATTSDFTRGAKEFKASVYNMDLRNYASILDWINEYKPHPEGKLYIKENRLVVPGEG